MQLGTPGMKFMVALDTGSDLFWVPCECSKCAPTQGSAYASVCFILTIYIYIYSLVSFYLIAKDSLLPILC